MAVVTLRMGKETLHVFAQRIDGGRLAPAPVMGCDAPEHGLDPAAVDLAL